MICHEYQCIFVHVPKTAGQSVEHVFLRLVGLDWERRAPLLLRKNDEPRLGPPRLAHLLAEEYVGHGWVPRAMFDAYFTFGFVRNPWDRTVSLYRYHGFDARCSFAEFATRHLWGDYWEEKFWFVRPQADFLLSSSLEPLVDFIGRFETLHDDFRRVCEALSLPDCDLPHVNAARHRKKGDGHGPSVKERLSGLWKPAAPRDYRDYYDSESRAAVAERYAVDIEGFGYAFDGAGGSGERGTGE